MKNFSLTTERESLEDRDLTHIKLQYGEMQRECTLAHLTRTDLDPVDVCLFLRSAADEIEKHHAKEAD